MTKITSLTAQTSAASSDNLPIVDNSGTPTTKKITWANLIKSILSQTKGNIPVSDGTTLGALTVGTNDYVLTADSAQTYGVKWAQASGVTKASPFFKKSGSNGDTFINIRLAGYYTISTISTTAPHTYTKYSSAETTRYEPFDQYANQTDADNSWVPIDTAKVRVNVSNDLLDFNCVADASNDSISCDLTSVSDSQWSLRFALKPTTTTDGANLLWYFGLSSTASSTGSDGAQDFIGLQVDYSSSNIIGTRDTDGTAPEAAGPDNTVSTPLADGTTTYFEINRTSTTAYNIKRYSDNTYQTVSATISGTCVATTAGLRYLKLMNYKSGSGAGSMVGTISEIYFINGTNSFES